MKRKKTIRGNRKKRETDKNGTRERTLSWLNSEQKIQTKILIQAKKIAKNKKMRPNEEKKGQGQDRGEVLGKARRKKERKKRKRPKKKRNKRTTKMISVVVHPAIIYDRSCEATNDGSCCDVGGTADCGVACD